MATFSLVKMRNNELNSSPMETIRPDRLPCGHLNGIFAFMMTSQIGEIYNASASPNMGDFVEVCQECFNGRVFKREFDLNGVSKITQMTEQLSIPKRLLFSQARNMTGVREILIKHGDEVHMRRCERCDMLEYKIDQCSRASPCRISGCSGNKPCYKWVDATCVMCGHAYPINAHSLMMYWPPTKTAENMGKQKSVGVAPAKAPDKNPYQNHRGVVDRRQFRSSSSSSSSNNNNNTPGEWEFVSALDDKMRLMAEVARTKEAEGVDSRRLREVKGTMYADLNDDRDELLNADADLERDEGDRDITTKVRRGGSIQNFARLVMVDFHLPVEVGNALDFNMQFGFGHWNPVNETNPYWRGYPNALKIGDRSETFAYETVVSEKYHYALDRDFAKNAERVWSKVNGVIMLTHDLYQNKVRDYPRDHLHFLSNDVHEDPLFKLTAPFGFIMARGRFVVFMEDEEIVKKGILGVWAIRFYNEYDVRRFIFCVFGDSAYGFLMPTTGAARQNAHNRFKSIENNMKED
jgi:hypothetical protein